MANYKVIATPTSDTETRLQAYYRFLEEKKNEELVFTDEDYVTPEEQAMYKAGWNLAFAIAKTNLRLWFPEMEVKENG